MNSLFFCDNLRWLYKPLRFPNHFNVMSASGRSRGRGVRAGVPVRNHSGLVAWSRSQSKSGSSDATGMKLYFLVAMPDCCGN